MKRDDYKFSEYVNHFIKKLAKHNDCIEVTSVGNETIIIYEDWEHEPIINYTSRFQEYKRTAEQRKRMSDSQKTRVRNPETNAKISKSMKDRNFSEVHKAKLSVAKIQYYRDLRDGAQEEIH